MSELRLSGRKLRFLVDMKGPGTERIVKMVEFQDNVSLNIEPQTVDVTNHATPIGVNESEITSTKISFSASGKMSANSPFFEEAVDNAITLKETYCEIHMADTWKIAGNSPISIQLTAQSNEKISFSISGEISQPAKLPIT